MINKSVIDIIKNVWYCVLIFLLLAGMTSSFWLTYLESSAAEKRMDVKAQEIEEFNGAEKKIIPCKMNKLKFYVEYSRVVSVVPFYTVFGRIKDIDVEPSFIILDDLGCSYSS